MFNLPKKTALCILVALGATGCLSTNNDQPQTKEPINTSAQKNNTDKKPSSNNTATEHKSNQSAVQNNSGKNPAPQADEKTATPAADNATQPQTQPENKKPDDTAHNAAPEKTTVPEKTTEPTTSAQPEQPPESAEPKSPAQSNQPTEPAEPKPVEPVTPPVIEKTEAQITAEKIDDFNQRNYQASAKSLQAKDYDGEDRYYSADTNIVMGDGKTITVNYGTSLVELPLGDFIQPTHGAGNYRKTEYGYNNIYSTALFSDFDARTSASIFGTPLNDLSALPQEGSAKYYGKFKGSEALNGDVVLDTNFADKTIEGKITNIKNEKTTLADITLEKADIKSVIDEWSFEDDATELVFEGKATGGKSEWQNMNYKGHFYGPTGEEAAAKLSSEVEKEFDGYRYPEKTAIGVFTTTRDDQK
ncbi:hypothetical protein HPC38_04350 [Pasteurellaceae bacterium HPA106]|uniref:factor H binding protein domain-containing protein n=1 Tax=Spirabiliibacterium pneumoniae TaxID=221400 RepID=UPI001AADAB86|nr:factor H binding protein domain-containing protein [Spirabiliibacterium pneumoniae]MBE2896105.1 hypothetical protein [Spirabiliibacterium pneumoniae]